MNPILSMSMWVSLPNEVRWKIRGLFGIPRSGFVTVTDGKIESDGTSPEDFKALTVEKMQKYIGDDSTDFHKLFDMVVAKVIEEMNPIKPEVKEVIKRKRKNANETKE